MTESIKTIKGRTLADIKSRKDIQVLNNKVGYMINITELGAVRDDSTVDNSVIIQKAFDEYETVIINGTYYTDMVNIDSYTNIQGDFTLIPYNTSQEYVIKVNSTVNLMGSMKIDGGRHVHYGMLLNGATCSYFNILEVSNCINSGIKTNNNDNNTIHFNNLTLYNNGTTMSKVGEVTSIYIDDSKERHIFIQFTDEIGMNYGVFAVKYNNVIYKAESDTPTTIKVYHLDEGVGVNCDVEIIFGAGFECKSSTKNNNNYTIDNLNCYDNTVGFLQDADYGTAIYNLNCYNNKLGYYCYNSSSNNVLSKPYFENNEIDYVCWDYNNMTIIEPNDFTTYSFKHDKEFIDGSSIIKNGNIEKITMEKYSVNNTANTVHVTDDKLYMLYYTGVKIRTIRFVQNGESDIRKEIIVYTTDTSSITLNFTCEEGYTVSKSNVVISEPTKIDVYLYDKMWIIKTY